jgi:predicted PurR-regulated permease PerM/phosphoglycolate phosphatase-like HAD superfamily hydrolase
VLNDGHRLTPSPPHSLTLPMTSRRWSNVTKSIVTALLALLAIALVVTFRAMIAPTIIAFLLAFVFSYPVNWMQRQTGWARATAVVVLYAIVLLLLLLTPALLIPRLVGLVTSLQQTLEELISSLQSFSTGLRVPLGEVHLSPDTLLQQAGDGLQSVLLATANPMSIFRGVSSGVLQVVYVLVVNFWLLVDAHKMRRFIFEQVPPDYQEDVRRLTTELGETWQAFLRGQIVLALVVGILTWIPLAIVGMPNAAGLAVLSGVMEFLPNIGQGISGTIGVAMALFQGSTWLPVNHLTFAVIVLVIYSLIAQTENVYLVPRLVGGQVKLHPVVAFVGTVAGALVFGVLGVLLAMPVIASARILLVYVMRKLLDREPFAPERSGQSAVRIPGLIAGRKIEAVIFDLDGVLVAVDWRATRWAVSYFYWLERLAPAVRRQQIARRLMMTLEGVINYLISQVWRFGWQDNPRIQQLFPSFDTLRGYAPAAQMTPIAEAVAVLPGLAASYRLALISARGRQEVEHFLRCAQLDPSIFATIVTREDVRSLLPRSEGLVLISERLGLTPGQLLMVSDTDVNLRAARAMEMATAGVLSGLGRAEEMTEADLVARTVGDLNEWL